MNKNYLNAKDILPKYLLSEIQKYVKGKHLYIPQTKRKAWGSSTGIRKELVKRNEEITREYMDGVSIRQLADRYHLSEERIRGIIHDRVNNEELRKENPF